MPRQAPAAAASHAATATDSAQATMAMPWPRKVVATPDSEKTISATGTMVARRSVIVRGKACDTPKAISAASRGQTQVGAPRRMAVNMVCAP